MQMETFPRYWPFARETTGHRWIPFTKASDAVLWCFRWSAPEQTVDQTIDLRRYRTHYDVSVMNMMDMVDDITGIGSEFKLIWKAMQIHNQ